ncbi:ankyrin repeat domain-containing protein [Candidatus Babeliales bacterium]|nr:ankyrin repeat domain-containing protein [Candidatus Babeliales bacterium]
MKLLAKSLATASAVIFISTTSCFSAASGNIFDAIQAGNTERVKALLPGEGIDARDWTGNTPLHKAVEKEHEEIVKLLLAAGANVEAKNDLCWTPVTGILNHKDTAVATLLKEYATNPQPLLVTEDGPVTLLEIARLTCNKKIITFLTEWQQEVASARIEPSEPEQRTSRSKKIKKRSTRKTYGKSSKHGKHNKASSKNN